MEDFSKISKRTKIGVILSIILTFLGIGFSVFNVVKLSNDEPIRTTLLIRSITYLVLFILIILYSLVRYNIPHENLLRVLFFTFSLVIAFNIMSYGIDADYAKSVYGSLCNFFGMVGALIIAYVSGRLNKIENNKILICFAGAFLLIHYVMPIIKGDILIYKLIGNCSPLFILFALYFAYVSRYEAHKAAGLSL